MKLNLIAFYCIIFLSCQKNNTLFEKLPSSQTNIHFANNLTSTEKINAFNFTNFYNGGGVAIADFNNDSLPDILFSGNQVPSTIYQNLGKLEFEDVTKTSGININGAWCTGISIADVNQDGWDDIYISTAKHNSILNSKNLLFINQKTKLISFKEEAKLYGIDYDGYSSQAAFFDFDLDNDLDLFILNTAPDLENPNILRRPINDGNHASTSKLYRNDIINGKISYKDISKEAGIVYEGLGLGLNISDLNSDGYPDIYCSNDFMSSDVFYLNNGDGTFTNNTKSSLAHTSKYGMGIDAADLNNDEKIDLIQLDMLPETNVRQKQMIPNQDYEKINRSISPEFDYQLQYMRNSFQLNIGNQNKQPIFSEIGLMAGVAKTDWSWAVLAADYDLDGNKDLFITNGYRKNVTDLDFILFNKENNIFGTKETQAQKIEENLSKLPEIKLRNYAFRSASNLSFENVSAKWGLDELSFANGAAYADLDLDGDLDLVVNNIDAEASVFENKISKKNYLKIKFKGIENNKKGIGAKVLVYTNGICQTYENYPIRGFQSSVENGLTIGMGKAKNIDSLLVFWPNKTRQAIFNISTNKTVILNQNSASFKNKKEIATKKKIFTLTSEPILKIENNWPSTNDFDHTAALHKMLSKNPAITIASDINNDGLIDLIFSNQDPTLPIKIFTKNKNGTYQNKSNLKIPLIQIGSILAFDANNDGFNDLLVTGTGFEKNNNLQPILLLNDKRGGFKSTSFPKLNINCISTQSVDYDQDGNQDLFLFGRLNNLTYPSVPKSYLLQNKGGVFIDVTNSIAPELSSIGMVTASQVADFDGDKQKDILLLGDWMQPTLLKLKAGKFIKENILEDAAGWYNSLATTDFDQDGDLDLLLGNEGQNTTFRANKNEPITIYGKDFNGDGIFDPIIGHYIEGIQVPYSPLGTLTKQIVQFRARYKKYSEYGQTTFDALLDNLDMTNAVKMNATELSSIYAKNLGNGKFTKHILPQLAQMAPIQNFTVEDFDSDGHQDALISGNFYYNDGNLGRQDAMPVLFLKGNGKGQFNCILPEKSGLFIKNEASNLIIDKQSKTIFINFRSSNPKIFSY